MTSGSLESWPAKVAGNHIRFCCARTYPNSDHLLRGPQALATRKLMQDMGFRPTRYPCLSLTLQPERDYDISGLRRLSGAARRGWGPRMVRARSVVAAVVAATGVIVVPAWPGDEPRHGHGPRLLLFSSTDLWRHGGFAHGGLVWSPGGIDNDGFALKLMLGGGTYRYISGALGDAEVSGRLLTAAILPGWRFVRGKLFITVYGGLDLQDHKLTPDDPSAGLRGSYAGLRGS